MPPIKPYRYEEIADALRRDIMTRRAPGDFLEPEAHISSRLAVSHKTVRQALMLLVDEGLIKRHRGRGTVVVDRMATGEFALVARPIMLSETASESYPLRVRLLTEALHQENSNWQVRLHLGRESETGEDFAETLDLLEPRVLHHLRGVFSFSQLYDTEQKLADAGIPLVMLANRGGTYRVKCDSGDVLRLGIDHLKEIGCRKVGLVWQTWRYRKQEPFEQKDRMFASLALGLGLECRPEWMPCLDGDITEQRGYALFAEFWSRVQDRPDGIVVVDDVLCKGALRAILQSGIVLPDDLRLVTQATHGVPLPYHLPVTRVEFDIAQQSRLATEMMVTLLKGRTPPENEIRVHGALVKGETT